MSGDFSLMMIWWAVWAGLGSMGWQLVKPVFKNWPDQGYAFGKISAAGVVTMLAWWLGMAGLSNGMIRIAAATACLAITAVVVKVKNRKNTQKTPIKEIIASEILFGACLILWSWVKAHEPSLNGLEKFMDFGFAKSILRSQSFPPLDMWFAGETINYYYFGHMLMAAVTAISGIDLTITFNLMLATIFSLCFGGSYAIGRYVFSKTKSVDFRAGVVGALVIAFLVTLGGNLQTVYAFTRGYSGDQPPPFWEIWSDFGDPQNLREGWEKYWYPNATRFIPWTIHEFPSYSFVVSDVHGHVLSIPIVLLLVAILADCFYKDANLSFKKTMLFGVVSGWAFMTNALDGPIYLGLFGLMLLVSGIQVSGFKVQAVRPGFISQAFIHLMVLTVAFMLTVGPFLVSFKPFVSGLAVNCPPKEMEGKKLGPLIFEEQEKCQKSPMWMLAVLWGFFWFNAAWLAGSRDTNRFWTVICVYATGLILFAEFFYFKDIYPQHFRSNTMFKLGYQAFMMLAMMSGFTMVMSRNFDWWKKTAYRISLTPLLALVVIYPYFGINSYFGQLKNYQSLEGMGWMREKLADDYQAINWLNSNEPEQVNIVEAHGDSYTDFARISTFSGLPTVAGWTVHEWLWRGGYEPIAGRNEEVKEFYEARSKEEAMEFVNKYGVKYVILGGLERQKYPGINEQLIKSLGETVFKSGATQVINVR